MYTKAAAFLMILGTVLCTALADEYLELVDYSNSDLKKLSCGIMPVDVEGKLALKTVLGRLPEEQQKKKLRSFLYTFLSENFKYESIFTSTVVCSSLIKLNLTRRRFKLQSGNYVAMNLPKDGDRLGISGGINHLLFLKIVYAFDDKDSTFLDWNWNHFLGPFPKLKTDVPEECIHYCCQFAFWNNRKGKIVSIGQVTAEDCGMPSYRYGKGGAWEKSIANLVKQILEETPFVSEGLDASDFD